MTGHRMINAVYRPNWRLAIRELHNPDAPLPSPGGFTEYATLETPGGGWCADPFLLENDGRLYVFCEYFEQSGNRGAIAAGELIGGRLVDLRVVIRNEYHMSYPCVFRHGGACYMVPETADGGRIDLYRAVELPYAWQLDSTLAKDIRCADITVFEHEGLLYAIGFKLAGRRNKICVFRLDMTVKSLETICEIDDSGEGRPAGSIILRDGALLRPAQVSIRKYGESIQFKEILSIAKGSFLEQTRSVLEGKDVSIGNGRAADRIHTINRCGTMEIIDFSIDTLDLFRPFRLLLSRFRKMQVVQWQ